MCKSPTYPWFIGGIWHQRKGINIATFSIYMGFFQCHYSIFPKLESGQYQFSVGHLSLGISNIEKNHRFRNLTQIVTFSIVVVASQYYESHYDLRQLKLAMENLEFIVDFPIKTFIHSGFPIAVFDCQRVSHFLYTAYYLKKTQQSNMMNPIQIFVKGTLVELLCIMIFSHFLYKIRE